MVGIWCQHACKSSQTQLLIPGGVYRARSGRRFVLNHTTTCASDTGKKGCTPVKILKDHLEPDIATRDLGKVQHTKATVLAKTRPFATDPDAEQ